MKISDIILLILFVFIAYKMLKPASAVDFADVDLEKVLILDVRTPGEFADGHLDRAQNIPVDQVSANVSKIETLAGGKDQPIIVYCRSGNRSGIASKTLQSSGFTNILDVGTMSNYHASVAALKKDELSQEPVKTQDATAP